MPPEPFTSPILFGREPDLAHLLDRVQRSGVTAVIARAQMGKSALLNELAARLTQRPDETLFKTPLVGITESLGETSDLLLRAVSSLYTCWIASSNFREQGGDMRLVAGRHDASIKLRDRQIGHDIDRGPAMHDATIDRDPGVAA